MKFFARPAMLLGCCLALLACHRHNDDLSQLGSPSHRLVGHWADDDGDQLYYGTPDATNGTGSLFMVYPDGRSTHHHYQLLNEEPSSQTAVVNLLFTGGDSRSEADVISADGRTLTIGTTINDDYITEKLQRVDNATVPPKSYYMAGVSDVPVRPELTSPVTPSWNPPAKTSLDRMVARQQAAGQIASYIIGLHLTAIAILLVVGLMYRSDLGWPRIFAHWGIAAIGGLACLFLLHAPIGAGALELAVGLAMLPKALFPGSSFD